MDNVICIQMKLQYAVAPSWHRLKCSHWSIRGPNIIHKVLSSPWCGWSSNGTWIESKIWPGHLQRARRPQSTLISDKFYMNRMLGGLNGSMQHLCSVYLLGFESPRSPEVSDSAAEQPD